MPSALSLAPPPAADGDGEKWTPSLLLSHALILILLKKKEMKKMLGRKEKNKQPSKWQAGVKTIHPQ